MLFQDTVFDSMQLEQRVHRLELAHSRFMALKSKRHTGSVKVGGETAEDSETNAGVGAVAVASGGGHGSQASDAAERSSAGIAGGSAAITKALEHESNLVQSETREIHAIVQRLMDTSVSELASWGDAQREYDRVWSTRSGEMGREREMHIKMGGPPPAPTREELQLMSGAVEGMEETVEELEARQNFGAPPPPPSLEELEAMEAMESARETEALEQDAGQSFVALPPPPTPEEPEATQTEALEKDAGQNFGAPPPPPTPEELGAMGAATGMENDAPKKKRRRRKRGVI